MENYVENVLTETSSMHQSYKDHYVTSKECELHRALFDQKVKYLEGDITEIKIDSRETKAMVLVMKKDFDEFKTKDFYEFKNKVALYETWTFRILLIIAALVSIGRVIDFSILGF